jgi:hypothetical protein
LHSAIKILHFYYFSLQLQHRNYQKPLQTVEIEDVLGVKCTFENACAWTWNEDVVDGFYIVSGANLTEANRTGIMPGNRHNYYNIYLY